MKRYKYKFNYDYKKKESQIRLNLLHYPSDYVHTNKKKRSLPGDPGNFFNFYTSMVSRAMHRCAILIWFYQNK